jgi:hypothetical protein
LRFRAPPGPFRALLESPRETMHFHLFVGPSPSNLQLAGPSFLCQEAACG